MIDATTTSDTGASIAIGDKVRHFSGMFVVQRISPDGTIVLMGPGTTFVCDVTQLEMYGFSRKQETDDEN